MKKINDIFSKGGQLPTLELEKVQALAADKAFAFILVECDKARTLSAILRAFSKAVDYPVSLGSDMDSFFDCLSETILDKGAVCMYVNNLHSGDPALQERAMEVIAVLDNVVEWALSKNKQFVYSVNHAGKLSDPDLGPKVQKYTEDNVEMPVIDDE